MRLAKYVWGGQGGDTQGRLAVLPPSLVAHLAERSVKKITLISDPGIVTGSLNNPQLQLI